MTTANFPRALRGLAERRPSLLDGAFLVAAVLASGALHLSDLGFHGDDWGWFGEIELLSDRSLAGIVDGLYERDVGLHQRPTQLLYVATMYSLFGLEPLGYHVVGLLMLAVVAVVLYATLRELRLPRAFAVAAPLIYALLPNYSGARLWFGAHTAVLSVLLLSIALYAYVRALRAGARAAWAWAGLGAVCVVASGLAYEVTPPVVGLVLLATALAHRRVARRASGTGRLVAVGGVYAAALIVTLAYKGLVTQRVGIEEPYVEYLLRIARGSVQVNFGAYGVALPYVIGWIAVRAPSASTFAVGLVLGVGVGAYVSRLLPPSIDLRRTALRLLAAGLAVFVAGCLIFVVPTLVQFESTGRDNRIGVAAALGVALVWTSVCAGVAALARTVSRQRVVFGLAVGAVSAAAFVATDTQAAFWGDAYVRQQAIDREIARRVPPIGRDGALILDGACMQRGGAWVLTGARDVTGLLRVRRGTPGIRGAAISRPVSIESTGLRVRAFSGATFFPFGSELVVYDLHRRAPFRLSTRAAALEYFRERPFRPEDSCPTVFAWGLEGV